MKNAISIFLLFFLFCAACSSDNNQAPAAATTTSQSDVENAAKYSLAAMNDNAGDASAIKKLHDVDTMMDLDQSRSASARRTGLDDTSDDSVTFPCGTLDFGQEMILITFNNADACDNITGTVAYSFAGEIGNASHDLTFTDIVYDECTINGSAASQFNANGDILTWTYALDDMSICGENYDGSIALSWDPGTGEFTYELYSQNYDYQSGTINVDTDIDYSDESGISGNATVTINGKAYECVAADIIIDKTCGVPTSGTLTVQGEGGNSVVFDFSDTTCQNKTVTYTLNGETHTYDLGEMAEMVIQAS